MHSTGSSSEKCLAIVKSKGVVEITRRRRKKLKMKMFILENRREGGMMMRSSFSGTERALLERGSLAVLPSGQGQTKGLVTAWGIYVR